MSNVFAILHKNVHNIETLHWIRRFLIPTVNKYLKLHDFLTKVRDG